MNKKIFIQIGLFSLILLIIFIAYSYYFETLKVDVLKTNQELKPNVENKIIDLKYTASDKEGNSYVITSDFGQISKENENVLNLEAVNAVITLNDADKIFIYSDHAIYNKLDLNTFFYDSVKLIYNEHNVTSEKIYLNYANKEVKIEDNIVYKVQKNKLTADVVDIDLISKKSKIYMLQDQKKVKVEIIENGNY
ncbi:LPS export ABC transporter periplasmic protein LptC [Pelagibacterales bacterium SAG-MED15]|nr:LPS export ABC transporter periplasmic protein LptC [Pelagibacterales bacterium SAG-MED15]